MTKLMSVLLGLLFPLILSAAELSKTAQDEINHLLGRLEKSGCQFYRNGSWYPPAKARTHLEMKYNYLLKKEMIKTAEDFIERAASQSSTSGRPYQVKCGNGSAITSAQWLKNELRRYRGALKQQRRESDGT